MRLRTALIAAAGFLLIGCNSQPYMTDARLEKGLAIVLTGIEGRSGFNEEICRGLDAAGVDWAIKLEDWTAPLGPLYNLRAEVRNRNRAEDIARRIERYRLNHPDCPVVLIGQSGGAAMAAWAVESLDPIYEVDGIIMLAPSLSPRYMLDWALARSRRGIVDFYSARDWVVLGVGTTVVGTMDGYHSESAGRKGFQVPDDPERAKLYEKLYQVAWEPRMARTGYTGGHLTSGTIWFVAEYVAPLVTARDWNEQVIADLVGEPETPMTGPGSAPTSRPAAAKRPPHTGADEGG